MGVATRQIHGVSDEPEVKLTPLARYILEKLANKFVADRVEFYGELRSADIESCLVGETAQYTKQELADLAQQDGFIDKVLTGRETEEKVYNAITYLRQLLKEKDFGITIWAVRVETIYPTQEIEEKEVKEFKYFIFPERENELLNDVEKDWKEKGEWGKLAKLSKFSRQVFDSQDARGTTLKENAKKMWEVHDSVNQLLLEHNEQLVLTEKGVSNNN